MSRSDARRMLAQGGVKLDGEPLIGSGHEEALLSAGFSRGPRKLTASA